MMGSFITLTALSFLSSTIIGILVTMPVLVIYYVFMKRARLYYKVKKQLKALQERNRELGRIAKQDPKDETEFSV
ncbi:MULTISPECIES: hypothetical protein [unclassified Bartonella]|uniref:hypothetical protein n=1 Tax=unclassified Bartonella TaxID=2645622 RepID=UPI0023626D0A|nr:MULTISPECIES: hypothetical protein [unclassified Bartonella]